MPRKLCLALLLAAACGNDAAIDGSDAGPGGGGGGGGDGGGGGGGGGTVDDAGTPVSGHAAVTPDAMWTDCQEATLHSEFTWIQDNIFTPTCATAQCHSGPNSAVHLNLGAGAAYNNLVNKGASTVSGWTRVVPGSLASSYLVVSLGRADGPMPRDGYMPLGDDYPLCIEKLEAIERWIIQGAQP